MSTLGLSGPQQEDEGLLKRLLWPSVRNAYDANVLGQQGFWLAHIIGILSAVILVFREHPVLAIVTLIFYGLGGFGLREGSTAAAALLLIAWVSDQVAAVVTHVGGIGFIQILVAAMLLSNLRGAMLVGRRNKTTPDENELEPMRFNETLLDKYRDQLPRRIWPSLRYVFYVFAVGFLALELLGAVVLVLHPHHGTPAPSPDATVSGQ